MDPSPLLLSTLFNRMMDDALNFRRDEHTSGKTSGSSNVDPDATGVLYFQEVSDFRSLLGLT